MKALGLLVRLWVVGLVVAGCGDDGGMDGGSGGNGGVPFVPDAFGEWLKFEPEGTVCSDGSPYAFYMSFSERSEDVIFYLMGGGACWDYEGCDPNNTSIRSAANPSGLPDNYANEHTMIGDFAVPVEVVYPLLNADPDVSPMSDWNKVFVPYCTGDVYSGNATIIYEDPNGVEPDIVFNHVGHTNVLAVVDMVSEMLPSVDRLFVGGCSAGGAGAIINYNFIRTGLNNVTRGYLLDDSGPIYPNSLPTSASLPLHNRVRSSWGVDDLIDSAPQSDSIFDDFGNLSTALAEEFPEDRLATTFFRLDYNFSLYSYERFWDRDEDTGVVEEFNGTGIGLDENIALDRAAIYRLWWDDTELLRAQYDAVDNLGYYLPFWRNTNDSHCVTIPGFEDNEDSIFLFINGDLDQFAYSGSEIDTDDGEINVLDYTRHLLDDETPLRRYIEEGPEGPVASCAPPFFDEAECLEAHTLD